MSRPSSGSLAKRQQGVVLVVALLFLLLLTVMAVVASSRALLQERMAGAMRSAQQAQWSAETALRGAEWQLFQNAAAVPCYYSTPTVGAIAQAFRTATGWFTTGGTTYQPSGIDYTAQTANSSLAFNPVYIVEYIGAVKAPSLGNNRATEVGQGNTNGSQINSLYRVTARGAGGNPNIVRVIETTVVANGGPACTL